MTMILPGALPQPAGAPRPDAALRFKGDGAEFIGLCARGALLQLITFGFYRFWLATDIRRHLWSATAIDGEPLEYTGRARELLIGFLIALAILVPINLAYFALGVAAESLQAFASVPFFLFFVVFGQFALFRARRYRLTRTIWRGVRFWMTGSGWNYAFRWLGWGLLTMLTLGLAYPWMRASLERYKLTHTFYGDLKGDFAGDGWTFFKRGIGIWLFCVAPLLMLLLGAVSAGALKEIGAELGFNGLEASSYAGLGIALIVIASLWIFAIPFVWPFFRALEWRWWAKGVRFAEIRLNSDLRGGALLVIYIKLFLMAMLVSSVVSIVIAVAGFFIAAAVGINATSFDAANMAKLSRSIPLLVGVVIGYLVGLLSIGIVQRFFLTREMWRVIASSIVVSHLESADGVVARGAAANALGEGFADGLDVAGF